MIMAYNKFATIERKLLWFQFNLQTKKVFLPYFKSRLAEEFTNMVNKDRSHSSFETYQS